MAEEARARRYLADYLEWFVGGGLPADHAPRPPVTTGHDDPGPCATIAALVADRHHQTTTEPSLATAKAMLPALRRALSAHGRVVLGRLPRFLFPGLVRSCAGPIIDAVAARINLDDVVAVVAATLRDDCEDDPPPAKRAKKS